MQKNKKSPPLGKYAEERALLIPVCKQSLQVIMLINWPYLPAALPINGR